MYGYPSLSFYHFNKVWGFYLVSECMYLLLIHNHYLCNYLSVCHSNSVSFKFFLAYLLALPTYLQFTVCLSTYSYLSVPFCNIWHPRRKVFFLSWPHPFRNDRWSYNWTVMRKFQLCKKLLVRPKHNCKFAKYSIQLLVSSYTFPRQLPIFTLPILFR